MSQKTTKQELKSGLLPTPPIPEDLEPVDLTENARKVLVRRYVRRGRDGKPAETVEEMFWRVAYHVAKVEESWGGEVLQRARAYYSLLTKKQFFPNSPTFTGAGTPLGQLAACFTADMEVTTDAGQTPIGNLQVGQRVLTHRGHFRPVTQVFQRVYEGDLLLIKVKSIGPVIEVTPEHPILTSEGWVKAGDLTKRSRVALGMLSAAVEIPGYNLGVRMFASEPVPHLETGRSMTSRAHSLGKSTIASDRGYGSRVDSSRDGRLYAGIESIRKVDYKGVVYNCEVDEDHTYVTEGVVVHNCFVLPISDDMGRDPAGIFQTLRDAALIQQTGGGNGFGFSRLRPQGALVKSSAGQATGPVGFLRVYDKAFGEIAQGGCLLPETLVFTEHGLLRLDEIADARRPGWQAHSLRVATDQGWRASPRAFNNGVAPVLRVRTQEGLSLTGTPEHRVKVMTARGPAWRKLQDLQPGDPILVKLGQHKGRWQGLRQPRRAASEAGFPKLPVLLDEELAFFLGCLAGSGEAGESVSVIVQGASYLRSEFPALLERVFGVQPRVEDNDSEMTFHLDHRAIADFLRLNGLDERRDPSATVPRLVRQSPLEVVGAYLRGLFETAGCPSRGYPSLATPSARLAEETATLLIGLGCPVQLNISEGGPVSQVSIETESGLRVWRERIGYDLRSPFATCSISPEPAFQGALETATGGVQLARQAARRSASLEDAPAPSEKGIWLVQVSKVEPAGEALTLDLEVDENHTYLAYGMVTHNTRRGANMAVLRVDHPDVEDFITCKTDENAITNFNISVGITDAFMDAVRNDESWDLRFPDVYNPDYPDFNGTLEQAEAAGIPIKVHKTVRARELFDKIVRQAHHNGEPGMLFLDAANRQNPVPHLYQLEATNPCGEQFLGSYENCCLGSVNLAQHMGPDGSVDWEKLRQSVVLSTTFLDDVVEANAYVPAVPQLREAALRARRIGLGIMGLGDLMYHVGARYGSPEGQEFAAQVMEFVRYHAMHTSIELAKSRGPFPAIQGSLYDPQDVKWSPPQPITPYAQDWGRPDLDWNSVMDGIRQHGIRNAAQTTIAPTGTIATVAGCEGYGCEPVFALAYIRHVNDNGVDLQLTYASPLFEKALEKAGVNEETRSRLVDHVMQQGSCQSLTEVPAAIRQVFVVSQDISAEEHVRMQAAMQAFVDNSLSKTINFPENASEQDVATAYMLAWELGCKGITVYVTGSRHKVVLETNATAKQKEAPAAQPAAQALVPQTAPQTAQLTIWHEKKKPRPRYLRGHTYSISTPLGKAFVTINENGGNQPFEAFINTSKAGSDTAAVSEAIGRLISYILRLASPVAPRDRLKEIWRQLSGIGGGRSLGFGPNRVRSLPDGVAQALAEYLESTAEQIQPEGEHGNGFRLASENAQPAPPPVPVEQPLLKIGDLCPECGQAAVVNEEGCRKCYACGFSEC